MIASLHTLTLADGLPTQSAGQTIRYRIVHLRETTVADERWAQRQAERVVTVAGAPKLLVSDADFRFAMTCRHATLSTGRGAHTARQTRFTIRSSPRTRPVFRATKHTITTAH